VIAAFARDVPPRCWCRRGDRRGRRDVRVWSILLQNSQNAVRSISRKLMKRDAIADRYRAGSPLLSTSGAHAQGSAGTGSTSTGIGEPAGPAGPGIRRNGWTQQPGAATNAGTINPNLTPAQKNSIPPPNRTTVSKEHEGESELDFWSSPNRGSQSAPRRREPRARPRATTKHNPRSMLSGVKE
jgi:hypothetical protein